jgi:aspartate ammonia-lyase
MLEDILEDEFNGSIDSVDHISSYFFNNAIPFVKRHENEIKKVAEALIEKGNLTTKEIMEVLK